MMQKKGVWNKLSMRMDGMKGEYILIARGFNATKNNTEKRGGLRRMTTVQRDFQNFIDSNNLKEL